MPAAKESMKAKESLGLMKSKTFLFDKPYPYKLERLPSQE